MFEYMTAQEASERWDISVRRVQRLCKEKRIEGVININRVWLIVGRRIEGDTNRELYFQTLSN